MLDDPVMGRVKFSVALDSKGETMVDHEAASLFEDLATRYPHAAAGLVDDLCYKLSALLENAIRDEQAIANACETLAQIFRPMDRTQLRDSCPWDAAYYRFGRWLMRGLPEYKNALLTITGWTNEQMAECKTRYIEMVRIFRDDWQRAASDLEEPIVE